MGIHNTTLLLLSFCSNTPDVDQWFYSKLLILFLQIKNVFFEKKSKKTTHLSRSQRQKGQIANQHHDFNTHVLYNQIQPVMCLKTLEGRAGFIFMGLPIVILSNLHATVRFNKNTFALWSEQQRGIYSRSVRILTVRLIRMWEKKLCLIVFLYSISIVYHILLCFESFWFCMWELVAEWSVYHSSLPYNITALQKAILGAVL